MEYLVFKYVAYFNLDHTQVINSNNNNNNSLAEGSGNQSMVIIIIVLAVVVMCAASVLVWLFFNWRFKGCKTSKKAETVALTEINKINIHPEKGRPIRFRGLSSGGSGAMAPLIPGGSIRSNSESRGMYPGELDGKKDFLIFLSCVYY